MKSYSWLILHRVRGAWSKYPKVKILITALTSSCFHSCIFQDRVSLMRMCVGSQRAGAVSGLWCREFTCMPVRTRIIGFWCSWEVWDTCSLCGSLLPAIGFDSVAQNEGFIYDFFLKANLTSEVNHQNDVSSKMLTLASAGLTQLILPWFGTDSVRLMSVSRAEWACAGFLFVPMCSGVFPVALSVIGIPASTCWLLSFLLFGLYLPFYELFFVDRLEFCSLSSTFL